MNFAFAQVINYDCKRCNTLEKAPLNYSWALDRSVSIAKRTAEKNTQSYGYQISFYSNDNKKFIPIRSRQSILILEVAQSIKNKRQAQNILLTLLPEQRNTLTSIKTEFHDNHIYLPIQNLKLSSDESKLMLNEPKKNLIGAMIIEPKANKKKLALASERDKYQYGDTLHVKFTADESMGIVQAVKANMLLPNEQAIELPVAISGDGNFEILYKFNTLENLGPSAWYLIVNIRYNYGEELISEQVKLPLEYSLPSAEIIKALPTAFKNKVSHIDADFSLQVATASRYAIEATLYGQCNQRKQALMHGQSAKWLDIGQGLLTLSFELDKLATGSCLEKLSIENIRLVDQGQLKSIQDYKPIQVVS